MSRLLKTYLWSIFLASFCLWLAWIFILFKTDPYGGEKWPLYLFMVTLFFALIGTLTLIGFYLRLWLSRGEIIYAHLFPAIRQAILISLVVIVLLILQILRLLSWLNGITLTIIILSLELFFRTKKEKVKRSNL